MAKTVGTEIPQLSGIGLSTAVFRLHRADTADLKAANPAAAASDKIILAVASSKYPNAFEAATPPILIADKYVL